MEKEKKLKKNRINTTRSSMPPYEEYIEKIKPLWDSHWLTNMGVYHKELEQKIKQYLMVENVSLMTNGHLALELAIQAMHLQGEVITTPFTFVSTTHAIVRNRLTPVFCDINAENYTIDTAKIEKLITEKTSAIIPVHVYGQVCKIEEIERIAKKYNLRVIYDAAHTFGETYQGKAVASYGDASILSFHATKVFNTVEGGAVVYDCDSYGQELYRLKNFGIRSPILVDGIGANAKMDEFRAIMGICNLGYIDEEIIKRKKVYERYVSNLRDKPGIKYLKVQEHVKSNYAYFPVELDPEILGYDRDNVQSWLAEHEIYARKYFYPLTPLMDCYSERFGQSEIPVAKGVSDRILALPLFSELSMEDVDKICDLVKGNRNV